MGRGEQLAVARRRRRFLFGLLSGYLQHVRKGRATLFARELGELPHGFANERDNLLSVQGGEFFIDRVHATAPSYRAELPNSRGSPLRTFKVSKPRWLRTAPENLRLDTKLFGCFRHATA
jgi:hypothetical protein